MGITGWTDTARDLRAERPALSALAAALIPHGGHDGLIQNGRHAALARHGSATEYADWRHPDRADPNVMLLLDGHLDNRARVEEQLYQRARPLSSDAEVLIHAHRRWGAAMVDRIDGTYTIAIWDEPARQLLLIRDPLGAKTLYWTPRPHGLLFASTATSMLAHPDIDARIDAEGLNELLTLGPVRTPGHAVIRGVRELLPGQLLRWTPAEIRLHRYWQLHAEEHGQHLDSTAHSVRQAIAEKTAPLRRRPAGAVLLSGGIGSATAAAVATALEGNRPDGYCLTLPVTASMGIEAGADITGVSRLAAHVGLEYTVAVAGESALLDANLAACGGLDFPGPGSVDATRLALLMYVASTGHTSVVTGDGAAAVFGAYPWLYRPESLAHDDFPWRPAGLAPTDLLNDDTRWHLIPGAYRQMRFEQALSCVPQLDGENVIARRQRIMGHLALTHYLPQHLVRLDALAATAGLTVHTPFADWLLAQYLWNVPHAMRHLHGIPRRAAAPRHRESAARRRDMATGPAVSPSTPAAGLAAAPARTPACDHQRPEGTAARSAAPRPGP